MARWLTFLTVLAFTGAASATEDAGASLLVPFKKQLKQALLEGMKQGPAEAVSACRDKAPQIAERLSRDGVRMGRTSDRLRNPANTGPDWVEPILEDYRESPSVRTPKTVKLENHRVGYVEPITVQPLCLTCHGENVSPDIAARLEALYPDDRATGYKQGDLRGVFWLEYSGSTPASRPAAVKGSTDG